MIIQQTWLLDLLNAQVQFRVPIYQRKYDWSNDDCRKFVDDIIDIAQDTQREQHFVGSIIYQHENGVATVGAVNINYLIDGQQRLTTLMLILWAVGHYAKETMNQAEYSTSDYSLFAIKRDYLTNDDRHSQTDYYYRLKPLDEDENAFRVLLEEDPLPAQMGENRIFQNYRCILNYLRKKDASPATVFAGIRRLVIANISLEARDNAQLLFEAVNSTGRPLNESDKVRNFLLMNAGDALQRQLYNLHWHPMEMRLGVSLDGGHNLNEFFKYYAAIITEEKVPDDYYEVFKDQYLGIGAAGIQQTIEMMDAYSVLYKQWLDSDALSTGTDLYLYRLKLTGIDKFIPVVLKVLNNVNMNLMSTDDANEALRLFETYIIRREMHDLRTNSISGAVVKILRSADSLLNIKKCILTELTDKQRMPRDAELRAKLESVDFYDLQHARLILDRMEKQLNPEYMADHTSVTIEHIMPQTIQSHDDLFARSDYSEQDKLDRDWATDLGDGWERIHDKYCNTLGNLTLTGYNTHLSNCRFIVKREMRAQAENGLIYGYSASAIRLSHGLRTLEQWGEQEILNRLDNLFTIIQTIWPYPTVPDDLVIADNNAAVYDDATARNLVATALFNGSDYNTVRQNRVFKNADGSESYSLFASKMYPQGNEEKYWFAYRPHSEEQEAADIVKYCIYICRSTSLKVFKIPCDLLDSLAVRMNQTRSEDGTISHYHIVIKKTLRGQYYLLLSKPSLERYDLSEYALDVEITSD